MTNVPSSAEQALQLVKSLRDELAQTVTDSFKSGYYDAAKERLARWKDGAVHALATEISPAAARTLERKRRADLFMTDPMGNIRAAAKMYDAVLLALEEQLRLHPERVLRLSNPPPPQPLAEQPMLAASPIFLIHGRDELNLLRLKTLIRDRWSINTVVMSDRPGKGRTLIEKFEEEAKPAVFALALLTPDDIVSTTHAQYAQARPNVLFELGWFYGRLGRPRVCILYKKGTQLHSDLDGISRIQFSETILEKVNEIEDELIAAGILSRRDSPPVA